MRPIYLLPACLLLLSLHFSNLHAQNILDAVVRIETTNVFGEVGENGSGIVVSQFGSTIYIATAYHVVRDAQSFQVNFHRQGGRNFPGTILPDNVNPELDLAVIKVDGVVGDFPRLQLLDPLQLKNGLAVQMIGQPRGGQPWEVNKLNTIKEMNVGLGKLTTTAEGIAEGFSGGPLLSKKNNRLIGLVLSGNNVQVNHLRIEEVFNQLRRWNIDPNLIKAYRRSLRKSTYLLGGLGGLAIGGGIYLNQQAQNNYKIYSENRVNTASVYQDLSRPDLETRINNQARWRDIAYITGGAFLASAVTVNLLRRSQIGQIGWIETRPVIYYAGLGGPQFGFALQF